MDNDRSNLSDLLDKVACVIRITHIKFNFDPTKHSADALNIRLDRTHEVPVPEWDGSFFLPQHSKAAYALEPTRNRMIFIQCRFEITPPELTHGTRWTSPHVIEYTWSWTYRRHHGRKRTLKSIHGPPHLITPLLLQIRAVSPIQMRRQH